MEGPWKEGRAAGVEQGIKQGISQGRQQGITHIAMNMLRDRYVIENDKPFVIGRLFLCDRDLYS